MKLNALAPQPAVFEQLQQTLPITLRLSHPAESHGMVNAVLTGY
ncbi:MAG: hypothetical protein P8J80_09675 [Porticoccaceae bacterium]|nr:hypothetical protein [Porticoccaceae bacterium]